MALGFDPATILQGLNSLPMLAAAQQGQDQTLQGLQQQAQGLQQQSGQAQGAYQQAAGQPFNPPADFAPSLLSNVASVLARNPGYAQMGQQRAMLDQQQAFQQRTQNLQSLADIYNRKADAAERLGDLVTAEKARAAHERVAGALQQIVTEARMQGALGVAGVRAGATEDSAALRAFATTEAARIRAQAEADKVQKTQQQQDYFDSLVRDTRNGSKYMDLTNVPKSQIPAAMEYAKSVGAVGADKGTRDRLDTADEVYRDFDDVEQVLRQHLYPGKDLQGTLKQAAINKWIASTQKDSDLAGYGTTQGVAIRNIQALAAGIGSGFRLNQNEINVIVRNFPQITDNLPTALRKLQFERTFLANKEQSLTGKLYGIHAKPDYKFDANGNPVAK